METEATRIHRQLMTVMHVARKSGFHEEAETLRSVLINGYAPNGFSVVVTVDYATIKSNFFKLKEELFMVLRDGYAPPGYRIARGFKEEQAYRSQFIPEMLAELREKDKERGEDGST